MSNQRILDIFLEREALFRNIFGAVDTPKIIYDIDAEIAKRQLIQVFWYDEEEIEKLFPTLIDTDQFGKTINAIFQFSAWAQVQAQEKK